MIYIYSYDKLNDKFKKVYDKKVGIRRKERELERMRRAAEYATNYHEQT